MQVKTLFHQRQPRDQLSDLGLLSHASIQFVQRILFLLNMLLVLLFQQLQENSVLRLPARCLAVAVVDFNDAVVDPVAGVVVMVVAALFPRHCEIPFC